MLKPSIVIGVTGGYSCGKTTLAGRFVHDLLLLQNNNDKSKIQHLLQTSPLFNEQRSYVFLLPLRLNVGSCYIKDLMAESSTENEFAVYKCIMTHDKNELNHHAETEYAHDIHA